MAITDDYELLYKTAKMYYYDKMSQIEIASATGLSRPTVSRLLETARASGMVHVTLQMPTVVKKEQQISQKLCNLLGLKRVITVPTTYDDATAESLEVLSHEVTLAAAAYMPELLADSNFIGIGWGRSVYNTALHLRHVPDGRTRFFIQLINNFPAGSSYLQTSIIVGRFAEAFGANGYSYYFNGISNSEADSENRYLLDGYWDKMDSAIISLASTGNLFFGYGYGYARDLWRANPMNTAPSASAHSFECLGQIYSDTGSCLAINKTFNMVALDVQRLKKIPNVICVAAGQKKAQALIDAGHLGFFSTLIVDTPTAEEIVQKLEQRPETLL